MCDQQLEVIEFILQLHPKTQSAPNRGLREAIKDILSSHGMLRDRVDEFIDNAEIRRAYDLPVNTEDFRDLHNWSSLIGDLVFRIPLVYMASTLHEQPMHLYEIAAVNPFTNSGMHYQKANHGLNDLILFDVAEDAVPSKHLHEWQGAVAAVQAAWLDFCHGEAPWPVAQGNLQELSPFNRIDNTSGSVLCQTLRELVGDSTAYRWTTILRWVSPPE
jgi:hypothetical protein